MADVTNDSESEEEYIIPKSTNWEYNESHPESKDVIEKQTALFEDQMDSLLQDLDETNVAAPSEEPENHPEDDLVDTAVNAIATQLEKLALLLNKARDNIDRKNVEHNASLHPYEIISESNDAPPKENPQDILREYARALWTVNQSDISEEEQETLLDQADLYMTEHKEELDLNYQYTPASGLSDVGLDLLHISIESSNIDWVILLLKHGAAVDSSHVDFAMHKYLQGLERRKNGQLTGTEKDERRIFQLVNIHKKV